LHVRCLETTTTLGPYIGERPRTPPLGTAREESAPAPGKTSPHAGGVILSGEVSSIVDGLKLSELPERDYYLGEDQEQKPVLMLAIRRECVKDDELVLVPGRDWFRYVHPCGGVACHQLAFAAATELSRKTDAILEGMWRISDDYHGSDLGRPVTLDDLVRYRYVLRKHLQADCNRDYETFEEGVYPVDLDHLWDLTGDPIPEDLNEVVRWKYQRITPVPPFGLWILGPDSD